MHATYYRPGGVYRDLPGQMPQYAPTDRHSDAETKARNEDRSGSLLDFIEAFTEAVPRLCGRVRNPAQRQPNLETTYR